MFSLLENATLVSWLTGIVLTILMLLLLLAICLFHRSQENDVERNRVRQTRPQFFRGRCLGLLGAFHHYHHHGHMSGVTRGDFHHHHQHLHHHHHHSPHRLHHHHRGAQH